MPQGHLHPPSPKAVLHEGGKAEPEVLQGEGLPAAGPEVGEAFHQPGEPGHLLLEEVQDLGLPGVLGGEGPEEDGHPGEGGAELVSEEGPGLLRLEAPAPGLGHVQEVEEARAGPRRKNPAPHLQHRLSPL